MVKTLLSGLIGLLIMIGASIFEFTYVRNSFEEFKDILVVAYNKIEDETAVKQDVLTAQEYWIEKKQALHVFIPHNDIKEIDLWVSEAVTLVENEEWNDALSKIDVVIELVEQLTPFAIDKSYFLS